MNSDSFAGAQNDLPRLAEALRSEAERIREFVLNAEEDGFLAFSRSLGRISIVGIAMTRLGIKDQTRPITKAKIDLVRKQAQLRSFPDYESKSHNLEVQFLEQGLALLDDVISRLSRWIDRNGKGTASGGQPSKDSGEIQTVATQVWPPDDGWHFRAGEVAYLGVVIPITGKLWGVLRSLAESSGPVEWGQLASAVSPDTTPNQETIKGYVSKVRAALRNAFDLDQSIDPIPNVEWGERTSWKLDSQVLRSATEKQR